MTEAKHFKNLHLQESHLRRQYLQDLQELRKLQGERKQKEEQTPIQRKPAARAASASGFEFTTSTTQEPASSNNLVTADVNTTHIGAGFDIGATRADLPS